LSEDEVQAVRAVAGSIRQAKQSVVSPAVALEIDYATQILQGVIDGKRLNGEGNEGAAPAPQTSGPPTRNKHCKGWHQALRTTTTTGSAAVAAPSLGGHSLRVRRRGDVLRTLGVLLGCGLLAGAWCGSGSRRWGRRRSRPSCGCVVRVRHPMGLSVKLPLVERARSRQWPRRRGCAF
jgi:hypothetical protein